MDSELEPQRAASAGTEDQQKRLNSINHTALPSTLTVTFSSRILATRECARVDAATGIITTIAGNGTYGYSGNSGPAASAMIANPQQLALDASGNLYIAEQGANVVAKVDLSAGVISTIAGNGTVGKGNGTENPIISGDGGTGHKGPAGPAPGSGIGCRWRCVHFRQQQSAGAHGIRSDRNHHHGGGDHSGLCG